MASRRAPTTVSATASRRLTDPQPLDRAKAALRDRMRAVRAAIGPEERARRSRRIEERLFALPEVASARTILLFYSFGSEVATGDMAGRVWSSGGRVLLPFLHEGRMHVAEVREGDELVPAPYGAKEPARRVPADPAEADVVITPGLAFDRGGGRLGYGGGHYDRLLDGLPRDRLRVGIAFAEQLVDEVPVGAKDRRVDLVVTDDEVIDARTG
ncbi:MAG TPA: 5-formyltetrahydrofolate cyclo-ligase [Actinomycetota bacterium]|nr:5-formyltetrahydrofolate cyclo-ligase [Actinomycetota bacterium]